MNCKPGEWAMYVGPCEEARGAVVLIVRADTMWPGAWVHEPSIQSLGHLSCSAWDAHLRPIRDPGEDATDEMIVLLGKPEKETV